MNGVDQTLMESVEEVRRLPEVDSLLFLVSQNALLKGCVPVALLWWAWFRDQPNRSETRARVLSVFAAGMVAIAFARVLAFVLPHRHRPLHQPDLGLSVPYGVSPLAFDGWSSFPSDHAVLFFSLAAGTWLVSRRLGMVALVHAVLVIALPRWILAFHYPSDLVAGALLGAGIGWLGTLAISRTRGMGGLVAWADARPARFYPLFLIFTAQLTEMFESTRALVGAALVYVWRLVS